MKEQKFFQLLNLLQQLVILAVVLVLMISSLLIIWIQDPDLQYLRTLAEEEKTGTSAAQNVVEDNVIVDGIHKATGFKEGEGLEKVITHCTACHSSKLVIQNRATREGWSQMIVWMQETQKLWDLGKDEEIVLDYLAKNYAPESVGRRQNLSNIEWYQLDKSSGSK